MKFSRLGGLFGILAWMVAGCVANVDGNLGGTGGSGSTACGAGLTMCSSTCSNTKNDPSNCGGCGKKCGSSEVCDNGTCAGSCSSGSMLCGASCVTPSSDPVHCGDCSTVCRSDQMCNGGSCVCPSGQSLCNGVCAASCSGGAGGMSGTTGSGGSTVLLACDTPMPGRSPLRRLTTLEYNNTVRDLLADTTNPASAFPPEDFGNGFGNSADSQSVQTDLAQAYSDVAAGIATRATASTTALGKLATCAGTTLAAANETACAKTIVTNLLSNAYRRVATAAEIDEYVSLYTTVRGLSSTLNFASGVSATIEAMLQAPDFLYKIEFGTADPANAGVKKLTGRELATRLSYLFWQTMPDSKLTAAADGNMLSTPAGVMSEAQRLLDDPKSHPMVAYYFDLVLPLPILTDLTRDKALFPTFTSAIGAAMRQETQRMIEYEIFENTTQAANSSFVPGSWPAILTAPYTFVNQTLFNYYGSGTFSGAAPTGTALQKVNYNTTQRLGLLSQGGVTAGTTITDLTNPVLRGSFIVNKLMCRGISFPTDQATVDKATQPVPYTGWTARERYGKHSADPVCAGCHKQMDPIGLGLENYDAVGLYRTAEHATINGETRDTPIDASGMIPGVGSWTTPIEMSQTIAAAEQTQTCFASHWMEFAYGRVLDAADACNKQTLNTTFKNAGYNIKKMLLALTQTDAFLYRSAQ